MGNIERWWRIRRTDGNVTWTDNDPTDKLTAAWEGATVRGPFVLETQGAESVVQAARVYFREFDHLIGEGDYPERRALRDALAAFKRGQ